MAIRRKPAVQAELPLMIKPRGLEVLAKEAKHCRNCDLWKTGTQTVFGEGAAHARLLFIGEQPGDKEDIEGRPFVGPAGNLLNTALEQAEIDRKDIYVTNAVKHFKWEARGKRRIHQKPNASEVAACRPWLDGELAAVKPEIIVCLGATAAQAIMGKNFRVTKQRGEFLKSPEGYTVIATVHPSSILRAVDEESRHEEMRLFVDDLRKVVERMHLTRAA
jgi:uracil-DNA glycosylase family protein